MADEISSGGFLSPKFHVQRVGEKDIKFYSMSFGLLKELKGVGKPTAKLLATVFGGVGQEQALKTNKKVIEAAPDDSGQPQTRSSEEASEIGAIDPKLAEVKLSARAGAVDDLVSSLLDERHHKLFVRIVMDSARDEFPRKLSAEAKGKLVDSMVSDGMDLLTAKDCLLGVIAANRDAVDPLKALARDVVRDEGQAPARD